MTLYTPNPRLAHSVLITAALLFGIASARGQEIGLLRLGPFSGTTTMRLEDERRATTLHSLERTYHESVTLETNGFVINPNLLSFHWQGDVGLFQESYTQPRYGRDARARSTSQQLTAILFGNTGHPISLAINKTGNAERLTYSGRNTYDITDMRASAQVRAFSFDSKFQAQQRQIRDEWSRPGFTSRRDQVRRSFNYSGRRLRKKSSIDLDYRFYGNENRLDGELSYFNQAGRMRIQRILDKSGNSIWESNLGLYRRRGLSDYSRADAKQTLNIQFHPALKSSLNYSFSSSRSFGRASLLNTMFTSVTHRLYASLTTILGAGGSYGTSRLGDYGNRNFGISLNYVKRLPMSGQFQVGYSYAQAYTTREMESTEHLVTDERHLFLGGLPIILNESNILASSIIVFDADTKRIYEEGEGSDYYIRVMGSRVEVHRNPLGRIEEGTAVLVEYRFMTLPTLKYSTITKTFNASLTFGKLTVYRTMNRHDLDVTPKTRGTQYFLGDIFTETDGARLDWRGTRLGMSVMAERKHRESLAYAYKQALLSQSLFVKVSDDLQIMYQITLSSLDHQRMQRKLNARSLGTEVRWRPTLDLAIQGYFRYRARHETSRSDEYNNEAGFIINRTWRVIRLKMAYEKRIWEIGLRLINERRLTVEIQRAF